MAKTLRFTPAQIERVLRARASHVPWSRLAEAHGVSVPGLRRHVDPEYRARMNAYLADYMRKRRARHGIQRASAETARRPWRPGDRIADQRREPPARPDPPRSLTAMLMGDPPPNRSALARHDRGMR